MTLIGLGGGREDRLEQLLCLLQPFRQRDAADRARLMVLRPAGAPQHRVAADDALHVQPLRLAHDHRPPDQLPWQLRGHAFDVGVVHDADEVVGDDVTRLLEPESGELSENKPLIGDAGGQDDVEGGDAVGGDDEQLVAQVVDVAHLAAGVERQLQGSLGEHGGGHSPTLRKLSSTCCV